MWPESGGFDLGHHAVLETSTMSLCLQLIILADRLGPDQARFLFITKALIIMCGMQADLPLCWSRTTKSEYIRLQTCGNNLCRDHLKVFTVFITMDGKTFQFYVKKLNGSKWKENPPILKEASIQKDIRSDCSN